MQINSKFLSSISNLSGNSSNPYTSSPNTYTSSLNTYTSSPSTTINPYVITTPYVVSDFTMRDSVEYISTALFNIFSEDLKEKLKPKPIIHMIGLNKIPHKSNLNNTPSKFHMIGIKSKCQ